MNLQPLYEVKERLEYAAVAGTGLLGEDFRLKRAAEAFQPLAAASPVFARIGAGLEQLLSAPPEARSGALLDLLALVDAVAYTQGRTGIEGELEPLPTGGGTYCPIPHSRLQPLVSALTTTGGGRMEVVQSAWENHPEFFSDYRVLPLLIQDLSDKFPYLADLNVKILTTLGPSVIPRLKEGFDPAGKSDMVRRVEAIEAVAGAAENGFYLEMLPQSKREVQLALIRALRHDPANGPKLLELCRTRKGDAQDTAYWALASSRSPEAQRHFEALAQTDADRALTYLGRVTGEPEWASRLTARLFQAELDRTESNPDLPLTIETQERFRLLLNALCHKTGAEIRDAYQRGAALGERLERSRTDGKEPMKFDLSFGLRQAAKDRWFRSALANVLEGMLMRSQDPALRTLALELYGQYGERWLPAALLAQLFTLDSAACYAWAEAQFYQTKLLKRSAHPEAVDAFSRVFGNVQWSVQRERYEISPLWNYGADAPFITPVPLLDPRWFGLFRDAGAPMQHLLINLLQTRKNEPEILAQMGNYLYHLAVTGANPNYTDMYIRVLSGLGWTGWKDFFVKRGKHVGEFLYLELKMGLENMNAPLEEKISQLEQLNALAKQKKVSIRYKGWPEADIQTWITQWKTAQAKGES